MFRFKIPVPDPDKIPLELDPYRHPIPLPKHDGPTTGAGMPVQDPGAAAQELCVTKVILSSVMGYGMGGLFGLVFGTWDSSAHIPLPGRELPKVPLSEQVRLQWRGTFKKSHSMGKNFLVFTALITGLECVIEKYRAKHDVKNAAIAGCITGATFAASQGPTAMCVGCAGFTAFSVAMDSLMDLH